MKKITLLTVLTATILTTASADLSFMGNMIRDMTNAAKEMKKDTINSVKDMKDDISDTGLKTVDKSKELKEEVKK